MPDDGYEPIQPGYSPPQKKGGFNWLACCGISCGVTLVIVIILFVTVGNIFNRFMGNAIKVATEIQQTDSATIRSAAKAEDAAAVAANPSAYTSDWVAMDCLVMSPQEFGSKYFGGSGNADDFDSTDFSSATGQQGTMYLVDGGYMVIDLSQAPSTAKPGDHIIAYGKPFIMDFKAIPGLANKVPAELDNLKMFMAKEVDTIPAIEDTTSEGGEPGSAESQTGDGAATE